MANLCMRIRLDWKGTVLDFSEVWKLQQCSLCLAAVYVSIIWTIISLQCCHCNWLNRAMSMTCFCGWFYVLWLTVISAVYNIASQATKYLGGAGHLFWRWKDLLMAVKLRGCWQRNLLSKLVQIIFFDSLGIIDTALLLFIDMLRCWIFWGVKIKRMETVSI